MVIFYVTGKNLSILEVTNCIFELRCSICSISVSSSTRHRKFFSSKFRVSPGGSYMARGRKSRVGILENFVESSLDRIFSLQVSLFRSRSSYVYARIYVGISLSHRRISRRNPRRDAGKLSSISFPLLNGATITIGGQKLPVR